MFQYIKNWWTTPSKHPVAYMIVGLGVAAMCAAFLYVIGKNASN